LGWGWFFHHHIYGDEHDMAIGAGSLIEVSVGGTIFSQQWMNVHTFRVVGEIGNPTAGEWGEAIWNDLKATLRPLVSAAHGGAFVFARVREMDDATGEFGEYAIPPGERAGTGPIGAGNVAPPMLAAGIRLAVSTRVTRPGQKRIPGADETEMNGATWEAIYMTKLNAHGAVLASHSTLGAPALGSEVAPVVVRKNPTTGLPTAHQDVTGFVVNPNITTQNSRKIGRGS
jgi:hypothetical protein